MIAVANGLKGAVMLISIPSSWKRTALFFLFNGANMREREREREKEREVFILYQNYRGFSLLLDPLFVGCIKHHNRAKLFTSQWSEKRGRRHSS